MTDDTRELQAGLRTQLWGLRRRPILPAFLVLGLLVGQRGEAARTPVDDVVPAIDQILLIQPDEYFPHRL